MKAIEMFDFGIITLAMGIVVAVPWLFLRNKVALLLEQIIQDPRTPEHVWKLYRRTNACACVLYIPAIGLIGNGIGFVLISGMHIFSFH